MLLTHKKSMMIYNALLVASLNMSGCSRTVLVSEASPIRVGPNCETQVYTLQDGEWRLSDNKVQIKEGWYCVPPSYVAKEK